MKRNATNIVAFPNQQPEVADRSDDRKLDINSHITQGRTGYVAYPTDYGLIIRDPQGNVAWQLIDMQREPVHTF